MTDPEGDQVGSLPVDQLVAGVTNALQARLHLPYERPPAPLTGNYRSRNYRAKAAATRQLRSDVMQVAKAAGLHRLTGIRHVTVQLVWAPGDRRHRDEDNLWPFLKVAADGLARGRRDWVGLELVPTDTPEHMTKKAPRIAPPPEPKGMWLDLTLAFHQDEPSPALGDQ